MLNFKEYNSNPKNKWTNDCVIRAITIATGYSWEDVFKGLCILGLEHCLMPNDPKLYSLYLIQLGWEKQPMPKLKSGKTYRRVRLGEFAGMENEGIFIVSTLRHLSVIKDGLIIDTWDCSRYYLGNYWVKK